MLKYILKDFFSKSIFLHILRKLTSYYSPNSSELQEALNPLCDTDASDLKAILITFDELETGSGISDPHLTELSGKIGV